MRILKVYLCLFASLITGNSFAQKAQKIYVHGRPMTHTPRVQANTVRSAGCQRLNNRSYNGTCNNISSLVTCDFGATDIPLERLQPAAYADGLNSLGSADSPNPRFISNIVMSQSGDMPNADNLSSMVFTWGQFLDHDITLSPETANDHADIPLASNETTFISPIEFKRSATYPGTGVSTPREQTNIITAWIDGSGVYGSDETRANWLRTFSDGKLKTSTGDYLPYNTTNGELDGSIDPNAPVMAGDNNGTTVTFVAGDVRAVEQPGLTALHVLFVREHNRICDELASSGMTDEEIYQLARKQVGGLIQKISLEDFLPSLGLNLGSYPGYDVTARPDIINEFSTAAYRIGHTMVTDNMPVEDENGDFNMVPLLACFFNPGIIPNNGIEKIFRGLSHQNQEEMDIFIVDALRNFLFPIPGSATTFGLDLGSLNLQRGRDHGLPTFMALRDGMFCDVITSFDEINPDPVISNRLSEAYDSIENIDLWVGLLAEKKMSNTIFGPTMYQILRKQFKAIRDGDFYYYKNDPYMPTDMRNQISITTLSDIIRRNSTADDLTGNLFFKQ